MMDRHHRQMVTLCEAIRDRVTRAVVRHKDAAGVFSQLVGFTAMHFEAEEELMRRSAYPGRMDHQDRHHELSLHLKSWDDRARRKDCPSLIGVCVPVGDVGSKPHIWVRIEGFRDFF
jgi:hemerythrin-like metal-binding protein